MYFCTNILLTNCATRYFLVVKIPTEAVPLLAVDPYSSLASSMLTNNKADMDNETPAPKKQYHEQIIEKLNKIRNAPGMRVVSSRTRAEIQEVHKEREKFRKTIPPEFLYHSEDNDSTTE